MVRNNQIEGKMVRINIIDPILLSDQHLIAEQVEILMLMSYILKYPKLDGTEPKEYTLNKGHMKFFKDKVLYLKNRYNSLHNEILRRGFNHEWKFPEIETIPENLFNDWVPKKKDFKIIIERITERIMRKPEWYRYMGQPAYKKLLRGYYN